MTDLTDLTLVEVLSALARKEFTAIELTEAYLKAMVKGRSLNAFITETPDYARALAYQSDVRYNSGRTGVLDGIPVAIKDIFCTKGILTTAGSRILSSFRPCYESTVSARLKDEGAVILGKTNLDEFAMGSASDTSYYGVVKNPWRCRLNPEIELTPGGSSGGSAAAVAAKLCLAAIGSDTGGSIRQPAAFCGVVGIKPTFGRCSRWGIIAFASSLDQAGAIARSVSDVAVILRVICGYDSKDATSSSFSVPDFSDIEDDIRGLKVGIPREYQDQVLSTEISSLWEQAISWLKAAGARPIVVSLPYTRYALATYYIIAPAEASSNLARYDGVKFGFRVDSDLLDEMYTKTRAAGFGKEVKRRILIGTYVLSAGYYDAYYLKAQKVRRLIANDFHKALTDVDVILTPTTPTAAFPIKNRVDDNPVSMYANDIFTVPASLAGLPAVSVPAGLSVDGLPLGLQVIGRPFDEETVLKIGRVIEREACFSPLENSEVLR